LWETVPKRKEKNEMGIKSRRALSPVVASIILIAVAVVLSIAVGAWTGALTFGFTSTEQVRISSMTFDIPSNTITVSVKNPGTSVVTIDEAWVNNVKQNSTNPVLPEVVTANSEMVLNVTLSSLEDGYNYQVGLVSSKGNKFLYTAHT
jgi:flagellin-like protein